MNASRPGHQQTPGDVSIRHFYSACRTPGRRVALYICARSGEERADGYINRIIAFCQGLNTFPLRGTKRDDLIVGLRTVGFERRVTIAFVVTEDAVLIEGIFYGGQDFATTFRD